MSWKSGSELMSDIISGLKKERINAFARGRIYKVLIPVFENYDCDTLYELCDEDVAFKTVFEDINPPEEE